MKGEVEQIAAVIQAWRNFKKKKKKEKGKRKRKAEIL